MCAALTWRSRFGSLVLAALLAGCSAPVGTTTGEPPATSLVGQWADIYTGTLPNGAPVIPSNGEAVWEIIIQSEGTTEVITLRGLWRFPDADGIRPKIVLTRVDTGTALPAG